LHLLCQERDADSRFYRQPAGAVCSDSTRDYGFRGRSFPVGSLIFRSVCE